MSSDPAPASASAAASRSVASSAYLLLVVAALCWAGNFVMGRAVHANIPPVTLTFWRWALAAALLLPLSGATVWRVRGRLLGHWKLLSLLAVTGVVLFHIFVYTGLRTTTATNAALTLAITPVVMPALSWLLLADSVSPRQALGIVVSLAGVAIIVLRGNLLQIASVELQPGDLWLLLAVPTWALYSVLLRKLPADVPRLALLLAINIVGLVMLAPLYGWEAGVAGGIALTVDNLFAIAYVGVFASVIAYICWNRAVMEVGANKAGLFLHLMPVFATGLAIVLLGESLRAYHLAGVAFIATGIYLTTTSRRRG